ncbi:MAG: GNAT family N-acetyltransferase [Gemmatimonadaceae bacterium]|nr:GNAT family N-acetyltransferase [Gemmatimonadaceae bacterium]
MDVHFRLARPDDVDALNALIHVSAEALSQGFYTPEEIDAANRYVFGVDTTLVDDRTYFIGECDGRPVACGGWSRRGALYGGDQRRMDAAPVLDPAHDPARIRAFFVHPDFARRGLGRRLLELCSDAARAEGYQALELMATLPGVPLYAAAGFAEIAAVRDRMPNGVEVRFVRMQRALPPVAPPS